MRKGLAYSVPLLISTACSDSSQSNNNVNFCIHPGEDLQAYYQLLNQNPKIVAATELCDRSTYLQTTLWNKVREAEKTGLSPSAPLPASYLDLEKKRKYSEISSKDFQSYSESFPAEYIKHQWKTERLEETVEILSSHEENPITKIYATLEEAEEIYAAHLAHSLWLEKNHIVPWSLAEYNDEQLKQLLGPKAWFRDWDEAKERYSFHLILDYSPRETFAIAKEAISSFSDQRSAMDKIIKATRPFRHGISASYDSEGNPTGDHDSMEIITVKEMEKEKVSRHGCQTMSHYIVSLANSLNIPGRYINGYYYAEGHRSALFDFTDDVLSHGDDVYHYNFLGNTPSSEIMDSHDFWEKNVLVYPKGDKTAAHNSMVHKYQKGMQYPAQSLIRGYCEEGRAYLQEAFIDTEFGPFATIEDIDKLEKKILVLSNNCSKPYPENNADL